ncbi:MAG: efflux RND transporter periplasmic adaptor subunit [Dehalococcoidia bacterium]|nr:efflux RND transporter periplasmic adaptor subunit [Dehalococcoidia bacterium]
MIRTYAKVALAGMLAIAVILSGCSQTTQPPAAKSGTPAPGSGLAAPVNVSVDTVRRGSLSSGLSFSGNVQARQQVNLVPKVSGRVTRLAVDVGSVVKTGDTLLELEQDTLNLQLAQAQAGLDGAQARLSGLEAGARPELVAQAQAGLDAAQARLNAMEAGPRVEQVGQVEANLKSAQARLDQIKAGPTEEQIHAAEAQVRVAKNQLYLQQLQADALLGGMFAGSFNYDQKNAQAGIISEQINFASANLAQLKAGASAEQLAQSEAAVEIARQQLAMAKQPLTEYDLQAAGAAVAQAQAAVDLARQPATKYDLLAARATVAQAQVAVDLARLQLAEATVKAPFAGVVSQRQASLGTMAGPTSPVLTLISADTEVAVNVDERSLATIKAGQTAKITASAYPGEEFSATVSSVAPSVDAKSRTAQVRLFPQDAAGKLRDGMFAQVQLSVGASNREALLVPKSAVVQESSNTVVYLVADGKVKRQIVTIGASSGDQIEIVAGLTEGQKVVISGLAGLQDGQEVSVR